MKNKRPPPLPGALQRNPCVLRKIIIKCTCGCCCCLTLPSLSSPLNSRGCVSVSMCTAKGWEQFACQLLLLLAAKLVDGTPLVQCAAVAASRVCFSFLRRKMRNFSRGIEEYNWIEGRTERSPRNLNIWLKASRAGFVFGFSEYNIFASMVAVEMYSLFWTSFKIIWRIRWTWFGGDWCSAGGASSGSTVVLYGGSTDDGKGAVVIERGRLEADEPSGKKKK